MRRLDRARADLHSGGGALGRLLRAGLAHFGEDSWRRTLPGGRLRASPGAV
jgi:hypothetical protein